MLSRLVRPATAGAAGAGTILMLRALGILEGYAAVVVLVVALVLLPTSAVLSRRILLVGSLVIGTSPLLWLVPVPTLGLGRTALATALVVGGLAAWVSVDPGPRARSLRPSWRTLDIVPLVAAAGAAFLASPWLRASGPSSSLALLQAGWDNSAHFSMTHMIRVLGRTYDGSSVGLAGESLKFADYPQGMHAFAATLVELLVGESTRDVGTELVAFDRALGLSVVAAVTLSAAAVCSMPRLRRRPGIALVATSVVVTALAVGPGAVLVAEGFFNFYLAVALCIAAVAVATTMPRVVMPLHLGALLATLVGVTYGWVALLALALPAALVALVPLRRSRFRGTWQRWAVCSTLVLLALAGAVRAATVLGSLDASEVLVIDGGIPALSLSLTVLTSVAAAGGCVLWTARRPLSAWWARRESWLTVVPLCGILVAGAMAGLQLDTSGQLSYYFWKFAYGLLLVSTAVAAVSFAHVVAQTVPDSRRGQSTAAVGSRRRAALAVGVSAGVTQIFGLTPVGTTLPVEVDLAPGIQVRADLERRAVSDEPALDAVVAAAESSLAQDSRQLAVLPLGAQRIHPLSAAQWALALTGSWTVEANEAATALLALDGTRATTTVVISALLGADPEATVVTDPKTLDRYLESGPGGDFASRIRTW